MDDTSSRTPASNRTPGMTDGPEVPVSRLEQLRALARRLPHPVDLWVRWIGGTAFRMYVRARRGLSRLSQIEVLPWRRAARAGARVRQVWAASPEERAQAHGLTWMHHPLVARRLSLKASGLPDADPYIHLKHRMADEGWSLPVPRVLSLGCGHGGLERGLIAIGVAERCDGIDLSPRAIEEARRLAAEAGLGQIEYRVADLEQAAFPEAAFDIVFAHQSMHHIEDLDGLCLAVRRALRPGGIFHLDEFVGPDRFQWEDTQLRHMNAFVEALPSRYRRLASGGLRPAITRPTIAEMLADDPSEAIRSSAIVETVRRHFRVVEVRELGGALLHMGLAGIVQNFDPGDPDDVAHLEAFFELEDRLMAEGVIGSDFATLTAVRD
jgi:SAM-dependent methyltransferase